MSYVHPVRVRYGECDMQRVVFNAHYFAYCDDAVDTWFRSVLGVEAGATDFAGFDFMLKTATVTWHAPLVFGDTAMLACRIARWGRTSFDVAIDGRVGDEERFEALITYVSVVHGANTPTPVPDAVRAAFST
jgi:acyl-CoA thioester hydrolase